MKCEHCELNSNSCQAATSRSNSALFVCSILINSSDECGIHSSETVFRFTRFLQPFQTDAIVQFAYSFRVCVVRWLLSYFDQLFIDDGDHCLYSIIFCISFHSSINPHLLIFVEWFIVCVWYERVPAFLCDIVPPLHGILLCYQAYHCSRPKQPSFLCFIVFHNCLHIDAINAQHTNTAVQTVCL